MTRHQFVNRLRSLYNIEQSSLPELPLSHWLEFRQDPCRYLINRADKRQATAIVREMEHRQEVKEINNDTD
jgi:hypothetical protein